MKNISLPLLFTGLISIGTISSAQANECDLERGKKIFTKCSACHSLAPNEHLMGPSLYAVLDRKAGSAIDFKYSSAMADSELTWNKAELSQFLKNPKEKMPGMVMPFSGIRKEKNRNAVICYIEQSTPKETENEK